MVDTKKLAALDALQLRYIRALDARDMEGWAACFGADGGYVCIPAENEEQGFELAIMMDDTRDRILDRVTYVNEVWSGTFEDYTTRHFVQRLDCAENGDGLVTAESNFMVAYTTARGASELLVAGIYRDEFEFGSDGAAFRSKTAVLDTVTTPRYLVYPV